MNLSDDRIALKLVRPFELGWTGTHATHVHMPEDYIENWKNEIVLNGYLVIQDYGIERISAYSLPTDGKWNNKPPRSPRIRKTPFKDNKGKYPSAWERIKKAGQLVKTKYKSDRILLITCKNTEKDNNFIILLCRLEDIILRELKNKTDLKITSVIPQNKTISKVFYKKDKSYKFIKDLSERLCDLIQIDIDEDKVEDDFFDFKNIGDAKKKIKKLITLRQGQPKFRNRLLKNYSFKCCISKCDVIDTLEACHIYSYMGPKTNHLTNGLILRSDLHILYDKGLICIDENYKVKISGKIKNSDWYSQFHGISITKPIENYPNKEAIKYKLMEFRD